MPKYSTIEQIAEAYVKANRINNLSVKDQVKQNFIRTMRTEHPTIKPSQVKFVSFDSISIVVGDELIDIEL